MDCSAVTDSARIPVRKLLAEIATNNHLKLYRRAMALTGESGDAWDLIQDVFERALTSAPPHIKRDRLESWLIVSLRNLFIDQLRHTQRARHVALQDELPSQTPPLDSDAPLARWRLVDEETLERAVSALEPRLREVYRLHAERRLPLSTIAKMLRIPVATVGTRLYRARRKLKATLESNLTPNEWLQFDHRELPRAYPKLSRPRTSFDYVSSVQNG